MIRAGFSMSCPEAKRSGAVEKRIEHKLHSLCIVSRAYIPAPDHRKPLVG